MNLEAAQQINGWMSYSELQYLAARARDSKVIIEFGCYKGRSTRALADNTPGIIFAVDPWNGYYPNNNGGKHAIDTNVYPEFEKNLADHIKSGKVIPVKEYSCQYRPPVMADFIFIDGDHRFDAVLEDIRHSLRFLRNGGILAGHDYSHADWPGVKQAVDMAFSGLDVMLIDSIWSIQL